MKLSKVFMACLVVTTASFVVAQQPDPTKPPPPGAKPPPLALSRHLPVVQCLRRHPVQSHRLRQLVECSPPPLALSRHLPVVQCHHHHPVQSLHHLAENHYLLLELQNHLAANG